MAILTNAAGRLYVLLEEGRQFAPNTVQLDGWTTLLRMDKATTDVSTLQAGIASVLY